jgi:7-cyano-7-deazaguanine synthase in queuosine biosynthesis
MEKMDKWDLKRVVLSWSGGIDSTAVAACLLARGYDVTAVSNSLYDDRTPFYARREAKARRALYEELLPIAKRSGGSIRCDHLDARFLWNFSIRDTMAIPQRNKRFIDLLMARYLIPRNIMNLAMGEYIGVDTWVVSDHVPPTDCDDRALSAYLFMEYGLGYRFISLADFGESRFKSDRLKLGSQHIDMSLTTNCMANMEVDCGECYKCIERSAAFRFSDIDDSTRYASDPRKHIAFEIYLRQMRGERVALPYNSFPQHQ